MGFFGVDEETTAYLRGTGRSEAAVVAFENYYQAQGLWGIPGRASAITAWIFRSIFPPWFRASPVRSAPRIASSCQNSAANFRKLLAQPMAEGGYGKDEEPLGVKVPVHINGSSSAQAARNAFHGRHQREDSYGRKERRQNVLEMISNRPATERHSDSSYQTADVEIGNGSVLIAAITSCTNTSNPSVMLGAGLLAKKAVEKGLKVNPAVKTSLGPGSRVVTDYLTKTGLQHYLDELGFQTVGYGCTTCIGNSGPLHPALEEAIAKHELGGRQRAVRQPELRGAGASEHQGKFPDVAAARGGVRAGGPGRYGSEQRSARHRADGAPVYLKDIWPSLREIREAMTSALKPEVFRRLYTDFANQNPKWNEIPSSVGEVYAWDQKSTYIQEPPFFDGFRDGARPHLRNQGRATARHLWRFRDHRSHQPGGRHQEEQPGGQIPHSRMASSRTTSIATVRGGAMTGS